MGVTRWWVAAALVATGSAMALILGLAATGLMVVAAEAAATACEAPSASSAATTNPSPTPCPEAGTALVPSGNSVIGSVPPPDPAASLAVAAAIEAVGRGGRYVAEGNGPVDFDCSGLTSFAWRAAGVGLVDYSYTQWSQTQRIDRGQLAPGDLVFWFGGDVHHVAIVVGVDGSRVQIAEAANPQSGVRIRDLGGSWDAAFLTGYGRVVR